MSKTERDIKDLQKESARLNKANKGQNRVEASTLNNLTFHWVGGTTTLSWNAGYLLDKSGTYISIPVGSTTLPASTKYWIAWNDSQKKMLFITTTLPDIWTNPSLYLIAAVQTAGAGTTSDIGGGGTEPGGVGLSGRNYI